MFIGIARVYKPIGVKGSVRVKYLYDETDGLVKYKHVWAFSHQTGELIKLRVESEDLRNQKIKFAEFSNPEDASILNGFYLGVSASVIPDDLARPPLHFKLIGMRVNLETGEDIGSVTEIIDLPVHPVLNIVRPSGNEFMVPYVAPIVINIDRIARIITIDSSRINLPN